MFGLGKGDGRRRSHATLLATPCCVRDRSPVRPVRLENGQTVGMRSMTVAPVRLMVVVAVLLGIAVPAGAATGAAACGAPDQAPGFESPARPGVVPQVRCMDLELARDKARVAGFTRIDWEDGTGRHRRPLEYRNWEVTDQTPSPGPGRRRRPVLVSRPRLWAA